MKKILFLFLVLIAGISNAQTNIFTGIEIKNSHSVDSSRIRKIWYNEATHVFRFWDGTGKHTLGSSTGGGGGITNGAANNELMKSNGTNAVASGIFSSSSGNVTTGAWQATVIAGLYGGTGVANSGKTITLGGNLTTSGAFNTIFTVTGSNTITFPNASITVARTDAGQTFTGNQTLTAILGTASTAVTQSSGDNTTKVASDAFVQQEILANSMVQADATHDGWLSSVDWNVFNAKLANLYTTGGDLMGGATGTGAQFRVASGAAGTFLRAGGSGTIFAWSTSTIPSSSGTSRKMLVSDGTNYVNSTETWAVPGTSGNILTSDGTNWTSAAPAAAGWALTGNTLVGTGTFGDISAGGFDVNVVTKNATRATVSSIGNWTFTETGQSSTHTFMQLTQGVNTGGSPVGIKFSGGAGTTLAIAEAVDVFLDLARTVQYAGGGGPVTRQRGVLITPPTYAFATSGGSPTIADAATLAVMTSSAGSGAPVAGTNATITRPYAIWAVGNVRFDGVIGSRGVAFTAGSEDGQNTIIQSNSVARLTFSNSGGVTWNTAVTAGTWLNFVQNIYTSGSGNKGFFWQGAAHTGQGASSEHLDWDLNFGTTMTFATGAKTLQRTFVIRGRTYNAAGASLTDDAVTAEILGAPIATGNMSHTNSHGLRVATAAVGSNTTNSYGLTIAAMTGATNNYAAQFSGGNTGFGTAAPTGVVHIKAGTTAAGTAPLKLTSGSLMTSAEAGAIEFLTDDFYASITTGPARKPIVLADVALVSGRLPYITTNGRLASANNYLFDTTNGILFGGTSFGSVTGLTLGTVGNGIVIKEGSGGRMGQTTLVSGTKAVTVASATTSTRCFVQLVTPSGVTLTTTYQCVCTASTVTIQANVAAGTINTADGSTLNYILYEPAP